MFVACDARTGDELWSFNTGLGMTAAPITYELNGKQYVSMLVGWGGGAACNARKGSDPFLRD